jgi:hypothetical protein
MRTIATGLVIMLVLAVAPAWALPLLSHALEGVVRAVDIKKRALEIDAGPTEGVREFIVVEGRTQLRRDKQAVTLDKLEVGQRVRLYYKRESGRLILTEIEWLTAASSKKLIDAR